MVVIPQSPALHGGDCMVMWTFCQKLAWLLEVTGALYFCAAHTATALSAWGAASAAESHSSFRQMPESTVGIVGHMFRHHATLQVLTFPEVSGMLVVDSHTVCARA